MFQHFGNRLKRDLKQIVDRRLEDNALASGSQVKVSHDNTKIYSYDLPVPFSRLVSRLMSSLTNVSVMLYGSADLLWPPW